MVYLSCERLKVKFVEGGCWMAISEKAQMMRNEYMRNYMQKYRKKHPSKKTEQDERYWEKKALDSKGGEVKYGKQDV